MWSLLTLLISQIAAANKTYFECAGQCKFNVGGYPTCLPAYSPTVSPIICNPKIGGIPLGCSSSRSPIMSVPPIIGRLGSDESPGYQYYSYSQSNPTFLNVTSWICPSDTIPIYANGIQNGCTMTNSNLKTCCRASQKIVEFITNSRAGTLSRILMCPPGYSIISSLPICNGTRFTAACNMVSESGMIVVIHNKTESLPAIQCKLISDACKGDKITWCPAAPIDPYNNRCMSPTSVVQGMLSSIVKCPLKWYPGSTGSCMTLDRDAALNPLCEPGWFVMWSRNEQPLCFADWYY